MQEVIIMIRYGIQAAGEGNEDMRKVRDSENLEGATVCGTGGAEGLLDSGKVRRWCS